MSEVPEQWAFLSAGWRVAYTLTGCREGATKVFKEAVKETLSNPGDGDILRLKTLFFTSLRRRSLAFPAKCEFSGFAADLHAQIEPGRSALTMLLCNALHAEEIGRVLNLDERRLAEVVEKTRAQLRAQVEAAS